MAIDAPGLPSNRLKRSDALAPSSTRATSLTRTVEPSGLARMTIFSNSSVLVSRPCVLIVNWNCWSGFSGAAPIRPTAACTFWAWMARATSAGLSPKLVSASGSSQIRIEYSSGPNSEASPTPCTRLSVSMMLIVA